MFPSIHKESLLIGSPVFPCDICACPCLPGPGGASQAAGRLRPLLGVNRVLARPESHSLFIFLGHGVA
jgi:hypothetical protein